MSDVNNAPATETPGQKLRRTTSAMRMSFRWLGTTRSLDIENRDEVAETLQADVKFLRLGKSIINTKNPHYSALTKLRSQATKLWRDNTLPYLEKGVRLIAKDRVSFVDGELKEIATQLADNAQILAERFSELKDEAAAKLGSAFREGDYPTEIASCFNLEWGFPSVEPPSYLKDIDPELYERESKRIAGIMEQIPHLAEKMFATEMQGLLTGFMDAMKPGPDGKIKKFRSSTVEINFLEFFKRFKELNPSDESKLKVLIEDAEKIITGVKAHDLRTNEDLRSALSQDLEVLSKAIETQIGVAPKRKLTKQTANAASPAATLPPTESSASDVSTVCSSDSAA